MTSTTPGAKALESRLYAPCCYNGTLDTHESDLAKSLRDEIEGRLAKGETSAAIQSDFIGRYGEKVVAARSDAPIYGMSAALAVVFAVVGISLVYVVRKWTRREAPAVASSEATPSAGRDDLDDRIDAELRDLDG